MQDYSHDSFYFFTHRNVVDRLKHTWRQKYWYQILPKNKSKSIAYTHIDIAYKKYRRYLRQYSQRIADRPTTGNNTNTATLTTLVLRASES